MKDFPEAKINNVLEDQVGLASVLRRALQLHRMLGPEAGNLPCARDLKKLDATDFGEWSRG